MRIALARRGYSPIGGAERYLSRFAEGLVARGHEPILVTTPDWPEEVWPHGDVMHIRAGSPRAFSRGVASAARGFGWDFLYSLERLKHCDAYRVGDGVHASWLQRRAAFEPDWKSKFRALQPKHRQMLALESSLFQGGAGRIIANSPMVAREIHQYFQTPEERIHVIPNGYDLSDEVRDRLPTMHQAARMALGIRSTSLLILFAGSGWERKGLQTLVDAHLALNNPNIHLAVIGKGKMQASLRADRVHYPPLPIGLPDLYAAADLFVLPTWYDPFSNACLEAAAHGNPVITTDANGFASCIEEGVTGSVCPPGDTTALCNAIEYWSDLDRVEAARTRCAEAVAPLTVEANVRATLAAFGLDA